jgi:superkiller protein 3
MKRSHGISLGLILVAALAIGCGDAEMNSSIEEMNEGVELAESGQLAAAESHLKKATSLATENHQAWYGLGQVLEAQRKWDEATRAYATAVQNNPQDAMYRYRLGHAHFEAEGEGRNLSEAQTNLEEAVKLNDRLYKAWFYLGAVYEARDQPKEAAEAWTRSATLVPSFGKPFNKLGILYIKWDKLDLAIKVLENGLVKVNGKYTVVDPVERSDIFYHLGLAYERKNQHDKAIEMYSEALELRTDNIDARRQRGFTYAEKGDKDNAIKDLEAFVKSGGGGNAFQIQAANERLLRLSYQ